MNELLRLEEIREKSYKENMKRQEVVKRWFDKKKASAITFREGDLVLRWDEIQVKLEKHTKFDSMWSGPYQIAKVVDPNAFELRKMDGRMLSITVNDQHLKLYSI